jgi:hypothetical protein
MNANEVDAYLICSMVFPGKINVMANSIELLLDVILEKAGVSANPRATLGAKINAFQKAAILKESKGDWNVEEIVIKLKDFNKSWNITKHGMIVCGTSDLTFYKDKGKYVFDKNKLDVIDREFSEVMATLTQITNCFVAQSNVT